MSNRITKKELAARIAERTGQDVEAATETIDSVLEEIYEALKRGESVSLLHFGTFYVQPKRSTWVFKFNPSQRLRALFGWSSTYKGDL